MMYSPGTDDSNQSEIRGKALPSSSGNWIPNLCRGRAGRQAANANDDAMAGQAFQTVRRIKNQRDRKRVAAIVFDRRNSRASADLKGGSCKGVVEPAKIGLSATGKLLVAIQQQYTVMGRQGERGFDGAVASADDDNCFANVMSGVINLILHQGRVGTSNLKSTQLTLPTDGNDHPFGVNLIAAGEREQKTSVLAANAKDVGVGPDIRPDCCELAAPAFQKLFPRCRSESQAAAQRQVRRFCHHQLALGIAGDRGGNGRGCFQQQVGQSDRGSACRRSEAGRSGADDRDRHLFNHGCCRT